MTGFPHPRSNGGRLGDVVLRFALPVLGTRLARLSARLSSPRAAAGFVPRQQCWRLALRPLLWLLRLLRLLLLQLPEQLLRRAPPQEPLLR